MCGICGEIDLQHHQVQSKTIEKMCRVLRHRGPDDGGAVFFRNGQPLEVGEAFEPVPGQQGFEAALGHRRLSIIDLSAAGHQPMANEDGSVWIVFNGEIYNFQGLREELEGKGHRFKSQSDTEVIVHAYEAWDVECLERFRGMFAFAIWDAKKRRLFLARDRLGKKPLVYSVKGRLLLFASEIKAILQHPGIERRLDLRALHHYLTFQYVPSPQTIFEGIRKLPPAHYLLFEGPGRVRVERYWRLRFGQAHDSPADPDELCDVVRAELKESVRLRLISDVPLGAFLSGGIDSSIIVGLMAQLCRRPVKTFSVGFEEPGFNELPHARMVSALFKTEHHEFVVKPKAIELLPRLAWHYNEPFADASSIPTYYVAHATKDHVKVVLTGDAGDENFAGYKRYLRSRWVAWFTKIPAPLRRHCVPVLLRAVPSVSGRGRPLSRIANFIDSLSNDPVRDYGEQIKIFNADEKADLYTDDLAQSLSGVDPFEFLLEKDAEVGTDDLLERLLSLDIQTYLPEDLLVKMDIAVMANSLEARAPFLDHQFMERMANVPSHLKLKGWRTKYILKKAYADLLPEPILKREKMGFGVPLSRWFRGELKDYARDILLDRRSLGRGTFRKEGIERLLREHAEGQDDHSAKIWALLFLEIWSRVYMDGEGGG